MEKQHREKQKKQQDRAEEKAHMAVLVAENAQVKHKNAKADAKYVDDM
jgi:hypothetical protein